jgi:hypothetical protein
MYEGGAGEHRNPKTIHLAKAVAAVAGWILCALVALMGCQVQRHPLGRVYDGPDVRGFKGDG